MLERPQQINELGGSGRRGTPRAAPSTLRLFNTLTRQVEDVSPIDPGRIRMYSCGPTVYRNVHIGNLRTFVMADWIRRALQTQGVRVEHVKNITDVGHMRQDRVDQGEDKMIAQALREGKTPWDIAREYTAAFMRDEARLHILPAHHFPRATEHIGDMIEMTRSLLALGFAYEAGGNVFFSVRAFARYGELSGNLLEYVGHGQVTTNEMTALKRAPEDFPLWKAAEPGRMMAWDSPWGVGFPGWHIECSAMSRVYLGEQIDIHTGGVDNIFPHHEDERAQSEAASGKPFVRLWVHGQHLLADGLKMAKSTGNAYTLDDLEARGHNPLALRMLFTTAKYRSRINFTFRSLAGAEVALARLHGLTARLAETCDGAVTDSEKVRQHPCWRQFLAAVNDDLNLPRAMNVVWSAARDERLPSALRLGLLYAFDEVLGFDLASTVLEARRQAREQRGEVVLAGGMRAELLTDDMLAIIRQRARLRQSGAFPAADALRAQARAAGFSLGDIPGATVVMPAPDDAPYISRSTDVPSRINEPDQYEFSVALLAHDNRDDLERCLRSVAQYARGQSVEVVILESGSTDDTLAFSRGLLRSRAIEGTPVRVLLADHDLGFAAGRNATFRACLGRVIVQLDTSIELTGDVWTPLRRVLDDRSVGVAGAFGLVSRDLKEFEEDGGPEVDAIEGYLFAFRRALLNEVGTADERFRFYRMLDVDYSLEFKRAGYRAEVSPEVAGRVIRHPHREWHQLTTEEQAARSKKNFELYWKRRHHAQSLLVVNRGLGHELPWGHDHDRDSSERTDPLYGHQPVPERLEHAHVHRHWPDHAHTHTHIHEPVGDHS